MHVVDDGLDFLPGQAVGQVEVHGGFQGLLHAEVELDFGLRAAGAGRNLAAVFENELEHVAAFEAGFGFEAGAQVLDFAGFVVAQLHHGLAGNGGGRGGAQVAHHLLDFLGPALALLGDGNQVLLVEAVLEVHGHHFLVQRVALVLGHGGHFGQQGAGRNGVLVAHEVANHVAVAFLAAPDVVFLAFQLADRLKSNVLAKNQR